MCTCLIMIIIVFKLKNKKNETEGQSEVHKICNIELLYACVCMCVITRWTSDKPLEQENKWKIYVDYWWKVNNIDHI